MLKGRLRVRVDQALLPVLVGLRSQPPLDAVPEAYHNPVAVRWGAFAPSRFVSSWTQVVTVGLRRTVAAGDGVHREFLPPPA